MKKVIKFLLPFAIAGSAFFSGCKKQEEDNRVLLTFGDIHASESRLIDVAKLAEITNAKENFLLVVTTDTCGCWNDFEPVLNSYLSKNKALCYQIPFNVFKDAAATYGLANASSSTTTFAIFESGKLKTFINSADDKFMYDENKFSQYMNEQIILSKCYFINKEDVATIKSSGKNAVIYFERSGCGDCTELNPGLLRTYVTQHKDMQNLYVLDCQEYWRRKSSDPDEYQAYLDFKDEMGMSAKNNPTYGYTMYPDNPDKMTPGVFPYFSYIENGNYASGCVIYNDSVTTQDDKYVIEESYYTSERASSLQYTNKVLKGLELNANDVEVRGAYVSWKRESMNNHYGEILNSFLDYALPKTSYKF